MIRILIYLIYEFLRLLSKISIAVFYHPVVTVNTEKIDIDEPAILVSNHPNTLLDPLNVGIRVRRQIYFLANSDLFASKIGNFFFSNVHCIPIQRKTDKHVVDNNSSFDKAIAFLAKGGLLYIAPEGDSEMGRRLRPLKSGTARIALATEAAHDWNLGLLILPAGLTYEKSNYFRTRSTVMGGEPIRVSDYRAAYEQDAYATVHQLTQELSTRMASLAVYTADESEDELLAQIETLYREENPISPKADFFRSRTLIKELQQIRVQDHHQYKQIQQSLQALFTEVKRHGINTKAIFDHQLRHSWGYSLLVLVVGLPFFLVGFLNNALAALIPVAIVGRIELYKGYEATAKALMGFITFAIFWGLQTWLIYHYFDAWAAFIYVVLLYPTGILAWEYYQYARQVLRNWRFRRLSKTQQSALIAQRTTAWRMIKELI
ncbi:MAG: 1-acyl-sn-glycerol-3-phosphate acyltransferase [Bacteroidota bacterium]